MQIPTVFNAVACKAAQRPADEIIFNYGRVSLNARKREFYNWRVSVTGAALDETDGRTDRRTSGRTRSGLRLISLRRDFTAARKGSLVKRRPR